MPLPPSFFEELRARLPVSEVAGKRLRLTRAGREYKACCPFHNEKTPSFYINDDKQFFHCFGCGAHGDVIGFAMRHDRLSFPEAVEQLAALAGMEVPRDTPMDRERFDREKRLHQLLERATAWFEEQLFMPSGNAALNYLRGRGLGDEAIRRFRLGYAPNDGQALIRKFTQPRHARAGGHPSPGREADPDSENNFSLQQREMDPRLRGDDAFSMEDLAAVGLAKKSEERNEYFSFFRNRVMFPVGDGKGRTVAFGGRVLGDGEPKYLNSPDHALFHKGRLLYGLSRARAAIAQNQPIIVAEGYMDVIALVEAGYSGAVAPLGTALTEDQLAALWKLLPPFEARDPARDYSPILCFDGDNAGQRAGLRALERALPLLSPTQTIRIATLPAGQDPDDLLRQAGKPAMDAALRQAKPMIEMIWETSLAGRRLETPEDRGAAIAALKQRVARIGNENLRKLYQDEIQKRLAAAFNWRGAGNAPDRQGWKNQPIAQITRISRNSPQSAQSLRERAFLALMINHPGLFTDFGEDFAKIGFANPEFEALRRQVTDILSLDSPEPLDAPGLYRHLSAGAEPDFGADSDSEASWRAGLAEVLSETTYMHAAFARPDAPFEKARQCWNSIWSKMLEEQLKADLENARKLHAQDRSDESYTRLMALREQIESLAREGTDTIFTETAAIPAQES